MFDFGAAYMASKVYEFNNSKERERKRRPRR